MHPHEALLGCRPRLLRVIAHASGHHQQQALAGAIKRYDTVVEPEPGLRKPTLIATARRYGLNQSHRVIAEVSHRAAGKGRQAFDGCHRSKIRGPPQFLDRRSVPRRSVDENRPPPNLDNAERIGADKGVASGPLATLDALEQEGIAAVGREARVDRERGHRIRGEFLNHRHHVMIAGEFQKLLFVRPNLHASPSAD